MPVLRECCRFLIDNHAGSTACAYVGGGEVGPESAGLVGDEIEVKVEFAKRRIVCIASNKVR